MTIGGLHAEETVDIGDSYLTVHGFMGACLTQCALHPFGKVQLHVIAFFRQADRQGLDIGLALVLVEVDAEVILFGSDIDAGT